MTKKPRYIIIAGGGKVGSHLAKMLTQHGKDVTLIEKSSEVCEKLAEELNALIICGDATDKKMLEEARIKEADVFVAATGNDLSLIHI